MQTWTYLVGQDMSKFVCSCKNYRWDMFRFACSCKLLQKKWKFYVVKCSSNPYLKMPGLWVQEDAGTEAGKGGYITAIHWITGNYSTDSCLRGTLLLSDKWTVWLICYNSKDLYSPSIHQSWLPHLISLRSWKQQGVWTIQRFILFFISCHKKLYFIHEYYTMLLTCQLAFVDWHGCHVD